MALACGGSIPYTKDPFRDHCYAYLPLFRRWFRTAGRLSVARRSHGGSVHPHLGLVMTGGYVGRINGKYTYAKLVEATRNGVEFDRSLPDMPVGRSMHCQVTADPNSIMVFGGYSEAGYLRSAYKLDLAANKWVRLPDLPEIARNQPACGLVKEGGLATKVVVMTGGTAESATSATDRSDILDLVDLKWTKG